MAGSASLLRNAFNIHVSRKIPFQTDRGRGSYATGVILDSRTVLTAAHVLNEFKQGFGSIKVAAGVNMKEVCLISLVCSLVLYSRDAQT